MSLLDNVLANLNRHNDELNRNFPDRKAPRIEATRLDPNLRMTSRNIKPMQRDGVTAYLLRPIDRRASRHFGTILVAGTKVEIIGSTDSVSIRAAGSYISTIIEDRAVEGVDFSFDPPVSPESRLDVSCGECGGLQTCEVSPDTDVMTQITKQLKPLGWRNVPTSRLSVYSDITYDFVCGDCFKKLERIFLEDKISKAEKTIAKARLAISKL